MPVILSVLVLAVGLVVVMILIVMVTLLLQILRWVPGTRQGQGMGLCLDF